MMGPKSRSQRSPRTWIQVLNYQGLHCIGDCLSSLEDARRPPGGTRLVVIDNDSNDGSLELLRRDFPKVEILQSERNLGFAGGNNLGLKRALEEGADYAILVNMDARVGRDAIVELVEAAETTPEATLIGATICTEDGKHIEFDGRQFDPVLTAGGYADTPRAKRPQKGTRVAAYACGAGMLVRLDHLREIGLFSDTFFAYHEDVELALRARLFGYQVVIAPNAVFFHARGGAGAGVPFRDFMGTRNLVLTLMKLYDRDSWRQNRATLEEHFLGGAFRQRPQALLAALFEAPVMLRQRRRLVAHAPNTYRQVVERLRGLG